MSTTTLRAAALCLGLLAALVLVACGGSSSSSTGTRGASAASTGTTGTTGATGATSTPGAATTGTTTTKVPASPTAVAYRKCLEAHGAGLPGSCRDPEDRSRSGTSSRPRA